MSTVITDIIGLVLSDQQAEFLVTENQTKLFSLTKNPASSNFQKFPEHSKNCVTNKKTGHLHEDWEYYDVFFYYGRPA